MRKKRKQKQPKAERAEAATSKTDALVTTEALSGAGFLATEADQQKFSSRILARAYSRMDLPRFRAPLFGAGAALAAAGAAISFGRGQLFATAIAAGAAAVMTVAFGAVFAGDRARRKADSEFDPRGCYVDEAGLLRPTLDEGEQLLLVRPADGRDRKLVRAISGAFQATWGVLLAGLPLATVAPGSVVGAVLALAGTLLGAGMFGRGVRTVFFHDPVRSWALTSQRLVGMVAPGAAVSIELSRLRHRPVVVGRPDGTATFAAEVRPLSAVAPLPMMGLVGFDALPTEEGEKWARATMGARRALLRDGKA